MSSGAERLLTNDEVAERLKVRPSTIPRWIRQGRLAAVRFGRRTLRVPESEVEKFIARGFIPASRTELSGDGQ
jgi:excisionase family DNA binding protein